VNSTFLNSLLSKASQMKDMVDWVKDVFPDIKLPTPFNVGAVQSCPQLWNSKTLTYPHPPGDMSEPKVREWLNNIAHNLAVVHEIMDGTLDQSNCAFDSRTAVKGPSGAFMLHKLDIFVIDRRPSTMQRRLRRNAFIGAESIALLRLPARNPWPRIFSVKSPKRRHAYLTCNLKGSLSAD
jgi:hypothetical protein